MIISKKCFLMCKEGACIAMAKIEDIQMKSRIYDRILGMILDRQLLPGEKIPELEVAHALGVSRTPVREAVRRLAWEGADHH